MTHGDTKEGLEKLSKAGKAGNKRMRDLGLANYFDSETGRRAVTERWKRYHAAKAQGQGAEN